MKVNETSLLKDLPFTRMLYGKRVGGRGDVHGVAKSPLKRQELSRRVALVFHIASSIWRRWMDWERLIRYSHFKNESILVSCSYWDSSSIRTAFCSGSLSECY